MMTGKIGILDFIPRDSNANAQEAFQNSLNLVRVADQMGLKRYWFAEHHSTPAIFGSTPMISAARALSSTEQIRVGTGSILVNNHPSYLVAEQLATLENMFPKRLDIGLGYSLPQEDVTSLFSLEQVSKSIPYEEHLALLLGLLEHSLPAEHPYRRLSVNPPQEEHGAPVYITAASERHIYFIAEQGLGLCYGLFLNPCPETCRQAIASYRKHFKPGPYFKKPHVILSLYAISAYDYALLPALETAINHWILTFRQDKRSVYQLLDLMHASDYPFDAEEEAILAQYQAAKVVGTPKELAKQLKHLKTTYQVDEFLILNQLASQAQRRELVEILGQIEL